MKNTRSWITIICSFLAIFFLWSIPVNAENHVETIWVEAILNKDGSMDVVQYWEGDFSEGTENYIPIRALSNIKIRNFTVSDEEWIYGTEDNWKVDASFEDKAYTCGVLPTDQGYELCFGISEYGHRVYEISYTLDNVVGSYEDVDGVNFRFINDQMNTTPTDVDIQIYLWDGTPITDDICDIWAFGYTGRVEFENGIIHGYTEEALQKENHMTIMFAFDKGIFSATRQEAGSFEAVKQRAFEGSDYDSTGSDMSDWEIWALIIGVCVLTVAVFFLPGRLKNKIYRHNIKKFGKTCGYFRDKPNEGNRNATYCLGKEFQVCKDGAILATTMLQLVTKGYLEPIKTQSKRGEEISLRLVRKPEKTEDAYEEYLYTLLGYAAGEDGILQKKELKNYFTKNPKRLRDFISKSEIEGADYIRHHKCFQGPICNRLKCLTPTGKSELGELLGLKEYLLDFSLIGERGIQEAVIWQDYMVYATLFGISKQVMKQFKELCPEIYQELVDYEQNMEYVEEYYWITYDAMRRQEIAREQAQRSSGSGGSSSSGGGGGSIGGGSGGGSR